MLRDASNIHPFQSARRWSGHGSRIIVLALNVLCVCACSMILPRPLTLEDPAGDSLDTGRCSLELDQSRQVAACAISAAGAPALITIRLSTRSSPDPGIRDRSLVEFASDRSSADTSYPLGGKWRVDLMHTASPSPSPHRLADGDLIYLWNVTAHRYLRVSSSERAVADARHRSDASIFALYKADVTNPNRPSTCDIHVRDGDYVLIRALGPSTWFSVSDGALRATSPRPPPERGQGVLTDGESKSASDQSCRTDERNQLLCGWAPHCLRP
jgi:hypothetical protein